eukprot:TRINITY_DN39989_c0_g1_i1.p1 TRINITY_DN39989_c0_g1~~TRINITY_DN39989_c0_g1_i1.p1  ORF type:complete len:190 (+),score=46.90 TRINITY_DN39989_c0_g1_i1:123-692(+)
MCIRDRIRREHRGLLEQGVPSDYSTQDSTREGGEHKMHSGEWSWRSFVSKGRTVEKMATKCPETADFLINTVGADLMLGTPFAFSFFSTLHAGSSIAAHAAPCNLRLRVHLPLDCPEDKSLESCGMRVNDQLVRWEPGSPVMFDDSYEHETWNRTATDRTVLLFDVWHPELTTQERDAIVRMFANPPPP